MFIKLTPRATRIFTSIMSVILVTVMSSTFFNNHSILYNISPWVHYLVWVALCYVLLLYVKRSVEASVIATQAAELLPWIDLTERLYSSGFFDKILEIEKLCESKEGNTVLIKATIEEDGTLVLEEQ